MLQARHISDLSDLDRTFLDQVPLLQRGEYITLPLRPETARAAFQYRTGLTP